MDQNIILLFGSESEERLVSVASAQALSLALGSPALWFWHKDGPIYKPSLDELLAHEQPFTNDFNTLEEPIFASIDEAIASEKAEGYTFVLATHGGRGENGFVQSLLELHKRPYTGSDAQSSARAFNKIRTKDQLASFNIKMAPHLVLHDLNESVIRELEDFFALHGDIILKPICGGSSIGCHFIRQEPDLKSVLKALVKAPQAYLAEKLIAGRELTVGVIETPEGPLALPVTEVSLAFKRDFDYEGKYLGRGSKEITPADVPESIAREAQRMAIAAHAGLKLEGYSRSDMMLAEDGLYFLETNTLPGLSKQSLVPQQLAAANITVREFLSYQIKLAQERASLRQHN